ncbi:MAG: hypothetical protein JWP97_6650 [Labilithrix sp.]|nr:hypothetical protein [Labilithrix sp.]
MVDAAPVPPATPPPAPRPPPPATDWCTPGLTALTADVCYVLPPLAAGRPRRLLVYLHGIVPPLPVSDQKTTVQQAVLHAAMRAGAAAIVPRGRRGIGPAGAVDWYAWPTDPASHARLVAEIIAGWQAARRALEEVAGAPFERTYLAGSSNGAYFVAAIALRGDAARNGFAVDGYGAMSGGAPIGRTPAPGAARPLYVGFGSQDAESKRGALSLAAVASAAGFSTLVREHPFGHGAREVYLDEAFAFWE